MRRYLSMTGAEWFMRLTKGYGCMARDDALDMLNGHLNEQYSQGEMLDLIVSYLGGLGSSYEVRSVMQAIYEIDF